MMLTALLEENYNHDFKLLRKSVLKIDTILIVKYIPSFVFIGANCEHLHSTLNVTDKIFSDFLSECVRKRFKIIYLLA